jgi:hypothetical protein
VVPLVSTWCEEIGEHIKRSVEKTITGAVERSVSPLANTDMMLRRRVSGIMTVRGNTMQTMSTLHHARASVEETKPPYKQYLDRNT